MTLARCRVPLTLAAVAVVFGCETQSLLPPPQTWSAEIVGTVRSTAGKPVRNANVVVRSLFIDDVGDAQLGRCSGSTALPLAAQTDAAGRFATTWHGAVDPAFVCMRVHSTGMVDGKLMSGIAELDSVTLGPTGLDSLHVNVVVQPDSLR